MSNERRANASVVVNYQSSDPAGTSSSCKPYEVYVQPGASIGGTLRITLLGRSSDLVGYTLQWNGSNKGGGTTAGILPHPDGAPLHLTEQVVFNSSNMTEVSRVLHGIIVGTLNAQICNFVDGQLQGFQGQAPANDYMYYSGKCICTRSGERVFGVLDITYACSPARRQWDLFPAAQNNLIAIMKNGVVVETTSVSLSGDGGGDGESASKLIRIKVVDLSTEAPIQGASVTVNGISRGMTNAEGFTASFTINKGTYPLRITKSGYISSDQDEISNEEIVVS